MSENIRLAAQPADILRNIALALPIDSLPALWQCSRGLRATCADDKFWQPRTRQDFPSETHDQQVAAGKWKEVYRQCSDAERRLASREGNAFLLVAEYARAMEDASISHGVLATRAGKGGPIEWIFVAHPEPREATLVIDCEDPAQHTRFGFHRVDSESMAHIFWTQGQHYEKCARAVALSPRHLRLLRNAKETDELDRVVKYLRQMFGDCFAPGVCEVPNTLPGELLVFDCPYFRICSDCQATVRANQESP